MKDFFVFWRNIGNIKIWRCIIIKNLKGIIVIVIIAIILFNPNGIVNSFSRWYTNKGTQVGEHLAKDLQYSTYDNSVLTGTYVYAAAGTANANNIPILVKTLKSNSFVEYTKTNTYKVTDKNDPNYIDNNAKFKFSLDKDEKGNIKGIRIEQQ